MKVELGRASDPANGRAEGASVRLDLDRFVATRMLIAASSGGGKSWALRRLLEQTHGRIQQLVLDYEGDFPTLREKFDYVLAGKGGEIAADPRYAARLCQRLMELGASAIVDLYELKVDARHAFVKVFLEALINLPKDLWHPCMVVVDEAHVFCPEKGKGESEASGAVIDLASRGRKRQFAAVLATQDIAKLNKDASGECRNRLIGLAVEDKTRKRSADELGIVDKAQILGLRDMAPGEFYTFGPAIANEVRRIQVGPVETTHDPKVGKKSAAPPPPREKVKALLAQLADLPAAAEEEANEIVRLRQDNARLKADLVRRPQVEVAKPVTIEVPVLKAEDVRKIEHAGAAVTAATQEVREASAAVRKVVEALASRVDFVAQTARDVTMAVQAVKATANGARPQAFVRPQPQGGLVPRPRPQVVHPAPGAVEATGAFGKGERKILAATAQYPDGATREQLTVLTGYKRSSRDSYIQRLQAKEYVQVEMNGRILATEAGIIALGDNFQPLPTGYELQRHWLERLPEGERKVLEILVQAYPQPVDRDSLSEATGYKRSSRDSYLQRLKARQLVTESGRGAVRASDMLFDDAVSRR
jgi:hypothetical protein